MDIYTDYKKEVLGAVYNLKYWIDQVYMSKKNADMLKRLCDQLFEKINDTCKGLSKEEQIEHGRLFLGIGCVEIPELNRRMREMDRITDKRNEKTLEPKNHE